MLGLDVGVEDLEEVLDAVGRRVFAERGEGFERTEVGVDVVDEGDRVEPEVRQPGGRDVLQVRGAERPRRAELAVAVRARAPDVGGVVGAEGGLHRASLERTGLGQPFEVGGRDEHDVQFVLADDLGDYVEELRPRPVPHELAVRIPDRPRARDRVRHVAVLGVGDNEIALGVVAGADLGELGV